MKNLVRRLSIVVLCCFTVSCSSGDKKIFLDGADTPSGNRCGAESFLNKYASYVCPSLELEHSNKYLKGNAPIHNVKGLVSNDQKLLIIDEKIFGATIRERDQEVLCQRRLKVILNPGTGLNNSYQVGWLTYHPKCLKFYRVRSANTK